MNLQQSVMFLIIPHCLQWFYGLQVIVSHFCFIIAGNFAQIAGKPCYIAGKAVPIADKSPHFINSIAFSGKRPIEHKIFLLI
ncbi:putative protein OS=Lysinibacillus sphaericus OX=1421 GN=LS41612_19185 PE=4 SV=1 [Lysinibacillus sphaericus]|uniref:Uncharacterized protein n=1 Tax=Lysinibacillus sphaericus TaxID=1421 RepID=A0A2S0K4H2_LYSSH|nr:hypothetical protein LS41612_19185 [Lysinibacillus sphaericus]